MLWAFMRSQRGNLDFYIKAESELRNRLSLIFSKLESKHSPRVNWFNYIRVQSTILKLKILMKYY